MAVEEENELDPSIASLNNFDKLSELQLHLIRHRELFLSRQIETYKIDMVRSVSSHTRRLAVVGAWGWVLQGGTRTTCV